MTAPESLCKLVETFEQNLNEYRTHKNETELRRQFLDPFFEALGWDVTNAKGYDERRKEVAHELSVEIDGQQKKADYAFRTGTDKFDFLVEAKKPSVKIESNPIPAFQLKRYGWSAKLPVNILTDFEHFAVYDCRVKPNHNDKVSAGRISLIHYKDYVEKWDEIVALFSPEAIRKGSLDKFTEGVKGRKGTADVDDAFLQEIERWRELLAKNIALRNPNIDVPGLNYAVQMTIDRIIFLRICEERGIEPENQLLDLVTHPLRPAFGGDTSPKSDWGSSDLGEGRVGVYSELCHLFQQADTKYNSGLFHFKHEKESISRPDDLTQGLDIDDKVLRDIISNLYYPKSPYAFLYIPSDILGQVYERFLGKVIRLTPAHQAKVDEKPEVRKAGGVFYTPTFIVTYIVANTLGKLLRGLTPKEAAKLKIVDPACGSGTFLLGVFEYLLDWHLNWFTENDPEKWVKSKAITPSVPAGYLPHFPQENGGGRVGVSYRLTTAKKKEILLNNVYGVDIDPQAVEVTKLSLLLKVLENASGQMELGMERILPDLGNNIKCGNSLVGEDYFEGKLIVDDDERQRINPFDWKREFPEVFDPHRHSVTPPPNSEVRNLGEVGRGFDVVVGNPPYIRIQAMQEWAAEQVEYFKRKYKAASKGNYDIYVVFIEKALSLLNEKGRLGFILPHKFFNAQYGEPVRDLIAQGRHISKVVHFGDQQVFEGATTYTCLLFLDKQGHDEFEFTKVSDLGNWRNVQTSEVSETSEVSGAINAANLTSAEWNFTVGKGAGLFEKLSRMPVKLGDVADIFVGLQTSADDVFIMDLIEEKANTLRLKSKALDTEWTLEKGLLFPIVSGTDVVRYTDLPERQYVLFPYEIENEKASLVEFSQIQKRFPKTADYLIANKKRLEERENGKMKGARWYGYIYLKNMTRQSTRKLCVPRLVDRLYSAYDIHANHFLDNVDVGGLTLKTEFEKHELIYLLGLLNSKLLRWYFPYISAPFRGGWFSANRQFLSQLPIRAINFSDPAEKAAHDKMVSLVESMLALHKSLASAQSPHEKERLERQIESTDGQIDRLVYELYGLTDEEIRIVES